MGKIITFDAAAREAVAAGIFEVVDCVKTTMGPFGYNAMLDNLYTEPEVTNDGATVVNAIDFEDRYKNMAAFMLKKACNYTNRIAGDGTTTCAVLAGAIIKEGLPHINNGVNPFKLAKYINLYVKDVKKYLDDHAIPVKDKEQIQRVAEISSQDPEMAKVITEAYEMVGSDGVVNVQQTRELGMNIELKKGLEWDMPMTSPHFCITVEENKRQQREIDTPYVFVTDKKLIGLKELGTLLQQVSVSGKTDIVFIVDDVDAHVLATLLVNNAQGNIRTCVVKAPSYGEYKEAFYEDICAITGATLISDKTGLAFKDVDISHLGKCEKFISGRSSTLIVGSSDENPKVNEIIDRLRTDIAGKKHDDYTRLKMSERLAKLAGGIATIKVGYPTDMETNNKRMKMEDAINAVKSAIQEGIIWGSGVSLIEAINQYAPGFDDFESEVAWKILSKALEYPTKTILNNCGLSGEYIVESIKAKQMIGYGYVLSKGEFGLLSPEGVIDPIKVVKAALENAASLAIMILTSKSIVIDDPKVKIDDQDARSV